MPFGGSRRRAVSVLGLRRGLLPITITNASFTAPGCDITLSLGLVQKIGPVRGIAADGSSEGKSPFFDEGSEQCCVRPITAESLMKSCNLESCNTVRNQARRIHPYLDCPICSGKKFGSEFALGRGSQEAAATTTPGRPISPL